MNPVPNNSQPSQPPSDLQRCRVGCSLPANPRTVSVVVRDAVLSDARRKIGHYLRRCARLMHMYRRILTPLALTAALALTACAPAPDTNPDADRAEAVREALEPSSPMYEGGATALTPAGATIDPETGTRTWTGRLDDAHTGPHIMCMEVPNNPARIACVTLDADREADEAEAEQ